MDKIESHRCFGGEQARYRHVSESLGCEMTFSVFLPPQAADGAVPVLYWLSGLTCNDENFVQKAGAQRYAAEAGIAIVCPDTSPRGDDVPDDPDAAYDFGLGAGFYLDATESPWSRHYHMESYISLELPALVATHLPVDSGRCGIFGHSMGGHGAITLGLKHPGVFRSISAFAPICAPTQCPWGQKALGGYLGDDPQHWQHHDSCRLIAQAQMQTPLLVDQGDADNFLTEQLKPELLQQACDQYEHPLTLRMQPGYDHSYFFIASFVADHIAHHKQQLTAG